MRGLRTSALIGALAAAMAGSAMAADLAGSEWRPVEIAGAAVPEGIEAFVQFRAENRVAGTGGCNRFTGSYAAGDGTLSFGPLATTRRACPPPVMAFEAGFLQAMTDVQGYARARIDLVLTDAGGGILMRLIQTDAD